MCCSNDCALAECPEHARVPITNCHSLVKLNLLLGNLGKSFSVLQVTSIKQNSVIILTALCFWLTNYRTQDIYSLSGKVLAVDT